MPPSISQISTTLHKTHVETMRCLQDAAMRVFRESAFSFCLKNSWFYWFEVFVHKQDEITINFAINADDIKNATRRIDTAFLLLLPSILIQNPFVYFMDTIKELVLWIVYRLQRSRDFFFHFIGRQIHKQSQMPYINIDLSS